LKLAGRIIIPDPRSNELCNVGLWLTPIGSGISILGIPILTMCAVSYVYTVIVYWSQIHWMFRKLRGRLPMDQGSVLITTGS